MSRVIPGSVAAVKAGLRKRLNAVSKAARIWWFYDFGLKILERAVQRAPIKSGKLRLSAWMTINSNVVVATGTTTGAKVKSRALGKSNREAVLTIGFGGAHGGGIKYAKYVHEVTWYKHKTGQAKFLQSVFMEALDQALPGLSTVVSGALKGGSE